MVDLIESMPLDQAFFDGKPGLDVETKAILFSENYTVDVLGCWDDLLGDDFLGKEE